MKDGGILEDWDHDGSPNYFEFRAGTSPTDPADAISMRVQGLRLQVNGSPDDIVSQAAITASQGRSSRSASLKRANQARVVARRPDQ